MKSQKSTLIGCLCALGCETLFGLSYLFTKDATVTASAFALLGWRFLVALIAISVCALTGLMKLRLGGKSLKPLLPIALLSPVIYFIGETFGISMTTASESGAFLACIPVVSIFASALILHKKPTWPQITGIVVTLAGVLITVFAVGASASFSAPGYLMMSIAVVAYALYSVYVEKTAGYSGAEITFVMIAAGAVFFVLAAVIEAALNGTLADLAALPVTDRGFLAAILYQGVCCSVFAFFLSNVAIARIGVNRTSSFIGVSTVVSILAGIVVLHEHFSPLQMIGAILIVCGVYIANTERGRR